MGIAGIGYLGIAKETVFGSTVAPTDYLPVENAELATDPQNYYPSQIRATRGQKVGQPMGRKNEFSVAQDGEPNTLGYWLMAALGAVSTSQPDAAGSPNAYQHVFTPANQLPSYSFEKYDNTMVQTVSGAKLDSLTITTEAGGEGALKVEAEFLAQKAEDKDAAAATPSYNDEAAFTFYQVAAEKGGVVTENIKSFELEISNNLKDDRYTLRNSRDVQDIPEGMREVTFSAEMYFEDKQGWTDFNDGKEDSIKFTFTGPTVEGGNEPFSLVIDLPKILWDGYEIPMGGADDEVMASIEGRALIADSGVGEVEATLVNAVATF